jgi:hypothetical protein
VAQLLLPLLLVAAVFVAVLGSGPPTPFPRRELPSEPSRLDACTWACHSRGCRHPPRLPPWLTADRGLFGQAIGGLRAVGQVLLPGRPREGYGLANLLIFCLLWPGLMWRLYWVAVQQRRKLGQLRRSAGGRR